MWLISPKRSCGSRQLAPSSPRTARAMDATAVRRLLCASKAPLGRVGDVMVQVYKDDARAFAHTTFLRGEVAIVDPAGRCRQRVGRGRCRRAVGRGTVVQICLVHSERATSDYNLGSLWHLRRTLSDYNRAALRAGQPLVPMDANGFIALPL